jgi:hypothetical protein
MFDGDRGVGIEIIEIRELCSFGFLMGMRGVLGLWRWGWKSVQSVLAPLTFTHA